jgi:hypothetical protein
VSLGDDISSLIGAANRTVAAASAPRGWEPRVEFDDTAGEGTTPPRPASDAPPSHEEILAEFGLDAAAWRVLTLRKSRWQAQSPDGPVWLEAYRATFAAVSPADPKVVAADVEELTAEVNAWSHTTPILPLHAGTRAAFVVALSDWQLGKGEGGGSLATVKRVLAAYDAAVARLAQLRTLGYDIRTVALVGLGDMVEQCNGHYDMQTYQADLDMREQRKLAWRLALRAVHTFAPLAERVLLTGIAGNHGESRNADGKAFTTFEDNDDLLLLDAVGDIIAAAPALENVAVELPADALAHTVELEGTLVGLVHGHQFRRGKSAGEKAHEWWKDQMLGLQPIKDANLLLNGHFHHLTLTEFAEAGRTTIQVPAMDGGSRWFTASSGMTAATGMLTLLVGANLGPRQWDELKVV